jgi:hypothetical protein
MAASTAEFRIGRATGPPGSAVSIPVNCTGAAGAVAAQFDVSFDPSLVTLTGIAGDPALSGHLVDQQQLAPGLWRGLFYSMTNGQIAPGAVVWLNFNIASNAPDGVVPLVLTNSTVARAAGQRVQPLAQINGAITVWSGEMFTAVELAGAGQLRTTILGSQGRVFTLQGTPDFFHWANLGAYTNETGTLVLTNVLQAGRKAYFYRTVLRPATSPPTVPAPTLSDIHLLADGRTRFQLNSTAGSAWRIEGSPDLFHWGNYGLVTNETGAQAITNAPFRKPGFYFYRAAQP